MDAKIEKADEDQSHSVVLTLRDLAAFLPAFNGNPRQMLMGVVSLWKMARGFPLGRTEAEIKAAKDDATALAAQLAAEAKVQANAINSNITNRFSLPLKYQMRLIDVAQRESADPTSLSAEDWFTIQGTTDKNHPDFHPDGFMFYATAKVVVDNMKAAEAGSENAIRFIKQKLNVVLEIQQVAVSADVTRTFLQAMGIHTIQTLILGNPRLDPLKIADTLGIPMPKEAVNAAIEQDRKAAEQGHKLGQPELKELNAKEPQKRLLVESRHQDVQLPKKKDFRLHLVEMLPLWAKLCISLILASLVFFFFQPNTPLYRPLYSPPQPVYVSPYTRSDGTSVSGYYRALPGEREKADAINEPIKNSNNKMRNDYNNELFMVWFGTIAVFIISWAYLNLEQ